MLVAKQTSEQGLTQQQVRKSSRNGILRRNTFSSGTTNRPHIWKRRGGGGRGDKTDPERRLSCVLEAEVITNSPSHYSSNNLTAAAEDGSHYSCSQFIGYKSDEKDFHVANMDRTVDRTNERSCTGTGGSIYNSSREKTHRRPPLDMAWTGNNKTSPSHQQQHHTAVSSSHSSLTTAGITTTDGGHQPSWLETLSNKLTAASSSSHDKGGGRKKKVNGIFGSLRGKSVSRTDKRRQSTTTLESLAAGGAPRSPLLVGQHKTDHHLPTSPITKQKLFIRPKLEAKSSTGFQTIDGEYRNNDVGTFHPCSSRNEFGSCHELSGEIRGVRERLNPNNNNDHGLVSVRKSSSLPRTLLCSPVLTKKGVRSSYRHNHQQQQRPSSQWLYSDFLTQEEGDDSSAPPSPPSSLSGHGGSSDTIQGSGVEPTSPIEIRASDWHLSANRNKSDNKVSKTSLTRSSSLPFESLDLVEKKPIIERGVPKGVASLVGVNGGRLTMRSQSFNTHFSIGGGGGGGKGHTHVQRRHSQESVVMREHIVRFLLETEHSYILSLRTLSKDYHQILSHMDCPSLHKVLQLVPQLATWHQSFANTVSQRLKDWCEDQTIGDVLVENFSQDLFITMYSEFVQHYSQARTTLETAKQNKASLTKALEELSRENRGKLSVEDLLIKPVQRIPRYLLFVKDLIRQTHNNHSDYEPLQQSQYQLSMMADHVNESERLSSLIQLQKELLNTVEGLSEALNGTSKLKRCDNVTEIRGSAQRKDRLIMLFTDRVVCASTRRRSAGFRKGSLMNVNSLQSDMMRYQKKWTAELSSISVNQFHAPLIERRKYNTLEKTLNNMQQDEAIVLQMINNCSSLHTPHQELTTTLNDLLTSLRNTMSSKRQEMDSLQLPHETARMDLTLHNTSPPNKLSLVFSSQKDRQEWEKTLRKLQLSSSPSPTKRPHPVSLYPSHHYSFISEGGERVRERSNSERGSSTSSGSMASVPKFLWHVGLPSCRVGSELSSVAVPSNSTNQFFVCINDNGGRGNVAILSALGGTSSGGGSTHIKDTPPQLVATLPLSSSRLLCSLCVEHQYQPVINQTNVNNSFMDDAISSVSLSDIESSISTIIPHDTSLYLNQRPSATTHASSYVIPSSCNETDNRTRYELGPPVPEGNQWLWLGSEEGILHILKVGVASLHVSSSLSVQIGSAILCLIADKGQVWAGLNNGRIALFNLSQEINQPERFLSVSSSSPIKSIASMKERKLVATGNRIVGVSSDLVCKELVSLSEHIDHMIVNNEWAYVAVKNSLTIHVCICDGVTMETILTVDCSNSITSSLKYYDPIIKQHKCTNPFITGFTANDSTLFIGTSTGVLVTMPLPPPSSGKPPPLHSLTRGHVDSVSTLFSVKLGHRRVFISGGHGLEELSKARASENVSETEGCLLFWYLSSKDIQTKGWSHDIV